MDGTGATKRRLTSRERGDDPDVFAGRSVEHYGLKEAAEALGVSRSTMKLMRHDHCAPAGNVCDRLKFWLVLACRRVDTPSSNT